MHQVPDILLLTEPIATDTLRTLVARFFEDMVKYVVDVERGIAAVVHLPHQHPPFAGEPEHGRSGRRSAGADERHHKWG
jgi:hypothetical protein